MLLLWCSNFYSTLAIPSLNSFSATSDKSNDVKANISIILFQTKELIAEIELLEQEVANREQHVLSLYRSIFEHCVSQVPSEQSSAMASPAHKKHASKKHPSIISSAFCSSKKFHLRPLQSLVSVSEHQKRMSKTSDAQFCGKSDIQFEKISSDPIKVHAYDIIVLLFKFIISLVMFVT